MVFIFSSSTYDFDDHFHAYSYAFSVLKHYRAIFLAFLNQVETQLCM